MGLADFRRMSDDELRDHLVQLKKEWFNLRFQRAGGQLENTARVRTVRRDIARILTLRNHRPDDGAAAKASAQKAKAKRDGGARA